MLTAALLDHLQTAEGEAALSAAADALDREKDFLRAAQQVGRFYPDALARAAVEQAQLRRRAVSKFDAPDDLFFTGEGLEQATTQNVARYRARRFQGASRVLDLTCGIGGDALQLALSAPLLAFDLDPLRLRILRANAARRSLQGRIRAVVGDARQRSIHPPRSSLLFADPSRRRSGRRIRNLEQTEPPLRAILEWMPHVAGGGVKTSPAVDLAETSHLPCELEFVSEKGELKEATLWFGDLRTAARRATILPGPASLTDDRPQEVATGPLGSYLIEPDPAVMRAGLVQTLGARIGARLLSPGIGFLTADRDTPTPFGRCYQILEAGRFRLKTLREVLTSRGVGRVTIKRRGSPVDPLALEGQLKLRGDREATVVLTRIGGISSMLLVEPVVRVPGA